MSGLQTLRKRHRIYTIAMIVVAALAIFLLMYYVGNGFSFNDTILFANEDCRVMLNTPTEGASYHHNEDIHVSGSVWGGIPSKVYIWDQRYNVPVLATVQGTTFGVMLYAEDMSDGEHILCVQAQTNDGRWTDIVTVTIHKTGGEAYYASVPDSWIVSGQTYSEAYLPQPLAVVFRPVEEVLSQIVVYVSGGTSDEDLNGDNIPDELQQAPTTPRYNPMNLPLSGVIIFGLIILLIIVIIFVIVKPYLRSEQEIKKNVVDDPEKRYWYLKLKMLQTSAYQKELHKERLKNRKLVEYIKQSHSKKQAGKTVKQQKPVKIYLKTKGDVKQPGLQVMPQRHPVTYNKAQGKSKWNPLNWKRGKE